MHIANEFKYLNILLEEIHALKNEHTYWHNSEDTEPQNRLPK